MNTKENLLEEKKQPEKMIQYLLNDQIVNRKVGKRKAPISLKEKSSQKGFAISSKFMSKLKFFLKKGFEVEAKKVARSPYHVALSYNNPMIIRGIFPDIKIDYSKAILSMGNMPLPNNILASLHKTGLRFSWDPNCDIPGCKPDDQVMLVAYFPEKGYGIELLNGEKRHKGEHLLELPASVNLTEVHTYMSFISADHGSISNSTYLGQFDWQTPLTP